MRKFLLSALGLLAFFGAANAATVTDELTSANFAATGQSYVVSDPVNGTSGAVYYAQTATQNLNGTNVIQLRATNPSGIVTTTSPGKVKKVTVEWNGTIDRTVDVYVSNSPYSTGADLYAPATQGSKAGSIKYTDGQTYVEIDGEYEYVAIRCNKSTLYLNKITIEWEVEGGDNPGGDNPGGGDQPGTGEEPGGEEPGTGEDPNADGSVTLDFTTNDLWNLPEEYVTTEETYNNGSYSVTFSKSNNGHKFGGSYVIYGKNGAALTLPAMDFAVEKIVVEGNGASASASVVQNIYVNDVAVSTATTGAQVTNTYIIDASARAAGTIYTLKITSRHNSQITKITFYPVGAETPKGDCDLAWNPTSVTWTLGADDNVMPTLANPHNLNVTYTSSNLAVASVDADGVVTLEGETGEAIIKAETTGNEYYNGGETSFVLTVVPAPDYVLAATLDFTGAVANWGMSNDNNTEEAEYTNGTYTITVNAPAGHKVNQNNYLFFGTTGATVTLPTFDFPVEMIKVYGNGGASGNVTFNIYVGENAVSTEATSSKEDHEFTIDENYRAAGTVYTIKVTNGYSCQIKKIELYKPNAVEPELHYVYANNLTGYENIYAYAWSGETPNEVIASAPWPGTAMEWDEDLTVWKVGFASVPEYIIFNNGGEIEDVQAEWKTEDLEFVEGKIYDLTLTSLPKHVYLVGSYNGWDRYNPIELTVDEEISNGTFSTGYESVNLESTTWFRFCTELAQNDDDWTLGTQYGAEENDEPIVFGEEGNYMGYAYECGNSWKINPGQYVFILNFDMYEQPMLWIMGTEAEPDYDLYVMGSHNKWTANDLSKMATEDNVTYTHTTTFPANSEFAIATSDWGTKYGKADITGSDDYTLTEGGPNITVPNKLENASLTFDRDAKTLTVSVPTGVAVINMEEGTVRYYNLQGVEVAQPENGVFITVKGGKVSKQIIR